MGAGSDTSEMAVPSESPRPWPVPTSYQHARKVFPTKNVSVFLPDELVTGELLWWLRSAEHGWYGYVTWCHRRTLHTEPIPAERLQPWPISPYGGR